MTLKLRDYQENVVKETYEKFQHFNRVLVMAPTGSGKSIIITKYCIDAIAQHKRVLVVAHRARLVNQLQEDIEKFTGQSVGIIKAGRKPNYNKYFVYIAMAQTLVNRDLPDDIDLVILDEAHATSYTRCFTKIMDHCFSPVWSLSKTKLIGLTATPWRSRKKEGFCSRFQQVIYAPSPGELTRLGYLTKARKYTYDSEGFENLKTGSDGDYTLKSLAQVCNEEYNEDIVNKFLSNFSDRKTIAFCATVKQAHHLAEVFNTKGIKASTVDGTMPESQRKPIYDNLEDGKIQVLTSVTTLCEGFNVTSIDAVILARPTKSPALLVQAIGRGLRLHEGKTDCIVLDFGGCFDNITKIGNHKIVDHTDIDYARLCPIGSQAPSAMTKECPYCESQILTFARFCPDCGWEFKGKEKVKPKVIEFPELVPYMTIEGFKQYKWLRTQVAKRFETRQSPLTLFAEFSRKYGRLPNNDYFLGALFNLDNCEMNYRKYKEYLRDTGVPVSQGLTFFELEFGKAGRVYTVNGFDYQCSDRLKNVVQKVLTTYTT